MASVALAECNFSIVSGQANNLANEPSGNQPLNSISAKSLNSSSETVIAKLDATISVDEKRDSSSGSFDLRHNQAELDGDTRNILHLDKQANSNKRSDIDSIASSPASLKRDAGIQVGKPALNNRHMNPIRSFFQFTAHLNQRLHLQSGRQTEPDLSGKVSERSTRRLSSSCELSPGCDRFQKLQVNGNQDLDDDLSQNQEDQAYQMPRLMALFSRYFGSSKQQQPRRRPQVSHSEPATPLRCANGPPQGVRSAAANGDLARPSVRFSQQTRVPEAPDLTEDEPEDEATARGLALVSALFGEPAPNEPRDGHHQDPTSGSRGPMNLEQFRHYSSRLIDYICNYLDTIRERRVTPLNIEPGYLKSLIDPAAPELGESFGKIMQDFEQHIMCGITHWQHPHFHAYFPAGNAYASILADMLSDALGCVGFSWAASPAYTELEIIMLDWMGKMIGLPDEFLCLSGSHESKGGGVIQGSASECVLVNLLAARHWAIEKLRKKYPGTADGILLSKLIGYCSKEAHSCVEKAAMIGFVRIRALDTDEHHSLRGSTLAKAIEMDLAQGLEPFIVCATLGTTSCVSFDNLDELGLVCEQMGNLWLHVDAAYAGSALICPEFKYLIKGIERVTSFNMNPNKWMLINFDCSLMWVKDRFKLTQAFVVDPLYLQHSYSDQAIDYRHWGIPLSRRFRALKLWFVIRNYGVEGLRNYIRNHVKLAKLFESLICADKRFTINNQVVLGLVCFRLQGSNALNQRLLSMINASGKLHMVPASLNGRFVIRFCVCDQNARESDIHYAYRCISEFASELLASVKLGKERLRATISQQNTVEILASSLPNTNSEQSIANSSFSNSHELQLKINSAEVAQQQQHQHQLHQRPQEVSLPSSPSPSTRLGVTSKSPLVKQPSMLASDQPGENSLDGSWERRDSSPTTINTEANELLSGPIQAETEGSEQLDFDEQLDEELEELEMERDCELGMGKTGHQQLNNQLNRDELFRLAQKRNRMSGRYKRQFFVRVVSDPRVYRASISGDINAHSSSSSLSSSQFQQQQPPTSCQTPISKLTHQTTNAL